VNNPLASYPLLEETIDLVKSLIVGNEALEAELAAIIIGDLDALTKSRDMDFVNKIFIPLIKLERTLPLTFAKAHGVRLEAAQQPTVVEEGQIVEPSADQALEPAKEDALNL
jgi:hypothetical protein